MNPGNPQAGARDAGEDFRCWVEEYCRSVWGAPPETWEKLAADGSDRRFFRAQAGQAAVVALSHPEGVPHGSGENDAFVNIGRHLLERGVAVARIHRYHRGRGWVIMEDLGDLSLYQAVREAQGPESIPEMYGPVLDLLLAFQLRGARGFRGSWCYQGARYDRRLMMERESGYFLQAFVKGYLGCSVEERTLLEEFRKLADMAARAPARFLLHRDFQSRNILFPRPNRPHLIDFQGARWGPLQYDVAALVIDPYVPLDRDSRGRILEAYVRRLEDSGTVETGSFMDHYPVIALHRNMQILGAFAFLGKIRQKPFFLRWIPAALENLRMLILEHGELRCPCLGDLVGYAAERGAGGLVPDGPPVA